MAWLSTVERARRVLRKKWGLPAEDEAKGDATEEVRQQCFMDLFKDPKTALETEAVRALFGRVGSSRSGVGAACRGAFSRVVVPRDRQPSLSLVVVFFLCFARSFLACN